MSEFGRRPEPEGRSQKLICKIRDLPRRVVERCRRDAKEKLGVVSDEQPWHHRDFSKRVTPIFERMRGLCRAHHMLSEVLRQLEQNQPDVAMALTARVQKSLVQCALDHSWSSAVLLWPHPHQLGGEEWGGREAEMKAVARYRKAIFELNSKLKKSENQGAHPQDDDGSGQPPPG